MMKKAILCILTLLTGSGLFSQTQEEPLTLETSTGTIYGTLLFPVSDQKMPLAIIISGSGPTDRDGNNPMMKNNGLKMLAERSEEHTSELQSRENLVCRLLLEKKKT